jgi:hypothetical protein
MVPIPGIGMVSPATYRSIREQVIHQIACLAAARKALSQIYRQPHHVHGWNERRLALRNTLINASAPMGPARIVGDDAFRGHQTGRSSVTMAHVALGMLTGRRHLGPSDDRYDAKALQYLRHLVASVTPAERPDEPT